jgi:6-phosphogluconolactonase
MPQLHVTDDLASVAGPLLARLLADRVALAGRAVLAVPGGSTPGPTLRWLADHLPDPVHDALTVTFVDERHLPVDADDDYADLPESSNTRLAWDHWFRHRPPRVLPWAVPGSLEEARAHLDAAVSALGGIDVALLGAGPDGHVASLFPGHEHPAGGTVVAVTNSPKPPAERLSLSAHALKRAGVRVLLARGADKADTLARAWAGDPSLPLTHAAPEHWVLDPAAASRLESP